MRPRILAIDIGSSSTRTSLFDHNGGCLPATARRETYAIAYGRDGAAELSPARLWTAFRKGIGPALDGSPSKDTRGIGVSSFWHGLLGLDHDWRPLTPIYTWADARAAAAAAELRRELSEKRIHNRTGCRLHSSFWPAKLCWLGKADRALFRKVRFWVSPVDWLLHRLGGSKQTTPSMASATGFYNLSRETWDAELCDAIGIRPDQLLPIIPSLHAETKRGHELPIFSLGDGAASNLGSGADEKGVVALNVGTSGAVRMVVPCSDQKTNFALFRYVLDRDRHVIGGAISNAGNLRQWALRELRISSDRKTEKALFDRVAAAQDGLIMLPFWVPERAPEWVARAPGVIYGLNQGTTAVEMTRALASAVFYRLAAILDLLGQSHRVRRVIVSGGILRSPPAIKLLADAIGRDIEVARDREASLRGAAIFALENLGFEKPGTRRGRLVKHSRALAGKHHKRRGRQEALERISSGSR